MNTVVTTRNDQPNFTAIKQKQQAAWGSGDYGKVGVTLQITGEQLCESMDLRAGMSVLDVAAGNGNVTLAAARRFCDVLSTDYVQSLLEQGRVRADAEGLDVRFEAADAENLPYEDNRFDNVVSTFGVMFAPDQITCARELMRVCKPGGKIGMANWTPAGFIGQLFKIIGQYVPPPAGVSSPALWGTEEFLHNNFGQHAENIEIRSKMFNFRYASPQHWVDVFRTYYGPFHKAILALDEEQGNQLQQDAINLIGKLNVAKDGTMVLPSEYLEIVITK
ncbi:MAG: class I SAM-dependent methyltransferase [Acidiferrobacterales bacterium]|nr:class I SAM-dependent methyltransferase [Acidiferrobacterales bacterium]